MSDTLSPFTEWAYAHGITMTSEEIPERTDGVDGWDEGASHFRVTIQGPRGRTMTTLFSQGSAHRRWTRKGVRTMRQYGDQGVKVGDRVGVFFRVKPYVARAMEDGGTEPISPEIGNVLFCLASDARGVTDALSFEDWAADYGYDTDSRKAEATYHACQRIASDLARILGRDVLQELVELEEGEPCKYPTDDEIRARFREEVLPHVPSDDEPAISEAFNNWTDMLCKDGQITAHQYDRITMEGDDE